MGAELLDLSKFKLQLLSLVSEARELRERERSAREELQISTQRQKQAEEEHAQKLQELCTELASRSENQHKLETKLKFLENENALLVKQEKELKETVNSLLQSKETFLRIHEDSTCELRRSIEIRDRKLAVLSEKIQAHILLLDSIAKEATAVKQTVDNVHRLVNEKEQLVTGLKGKVDNISIFEKEFVEKFFVLENKLNDYQHEIRKRDIAILELKEHLNAEKTRSYFQPEVEELQKSLLVKEEAIQCLASENQTLHLELKNFEVVQRKIQDIFINLRAEDQNVLSSSVMGGQDVCEMMSREHEISENIVQAVGDNSPGKISGGIPKEQTETQIQNSS